MSDKDEYRFYPEDFDNDGRRPDVETNPAPQVIVGCFGIGLGFLVVRFFVDSVVVYGTAISLVGLATAMFVFGLIGGGGSYIRQGRVRLGTIHIAGAIGWLSIGLARAFSGSIALAVASTMLIVGAVALFVLTRYPPT